MDHGVHHADVRPLQAAALIEAAALLVETHGELQRQVGVRFCESLVAWLREEADAASEHDERGRDAETLFAGDETLCPSELHAVALARALLGAHAEVDVTVSGDVTR